MKKITVILTLTILISACKSTNTVNHTAPNKYTKILSGNHSHFDKQSYTLIKSAKELEVIYTTLNKTKTPKYEMPKINFSKEVVVGLFMGSKASGGYSIGIDHIQSDTKYTAIFIKETKPTGMATSVMTQPFYLAKIAKPAKPIRFITFPKK